MPAPLFGLHCATKMPRGAYELFEFALRSAPDIRAALTHLDRFGDQLNPAVRFSVEQTSDEVRLHHRVNRGGDGVGRQGNIFTVARMLIMAREMLDDALTPTRVWFHHEEKRPSPELVQFFGGAELLFGRSSNGLALQGESLNRPVKGADPALHAVLAQSAVKAAGKTASRSFRDQVLSAMKALLETGISVEKVAGELHLSDRTLQRRLQEDGLNFAALQEELRADTAKALLAGELSVAEVAKKVGYADAAAFARAFKRWTGVTPGVWRERHGRGLA